MWIPSRIPTSRAQVREIFERAGFATNVVTSLSVPIVPSLREYHARLPAASQSKLRQLSEEELDGGLRRLLVDADRVERPVEERYDVAVFTAV